MSDNQKNQQAGDRSDGKSKGFEKRNDPNEVPKKQQVPNEEVPNVGDHGKKGPTVDPTRKLSAESENQENENQGEESRRKILNQDNTELEEPQPEEQEAK